MRVIERIRERVMRGVSVYHDFVVGVFYFIYIIIIHVVLIFIYFMEGFI